MINKKEYPLALVKAIGQLYSSIRTYVAQNSDILEIVKDKELELKVVDSSKHSNFEFLVHKPKFENGKAIFYVEHNPENTVSLKKRSLSIMPDSVLKTLKAWTGWIREYNKASLSPEDKILNEYENEFFQNFELLDENADTHPFELEKQIIIHNYLLQVVQILEKDKKNNAVLISEANELKEQIPSLTKRKTVKKLSRFFANVRKKSLVLLKEILVEAKKELYKRAIKGGFDFVGELLSGI
ncbi:hypothetical protein [Croceivirga radicis]|uniref:hypothetical protein n=1 Tax=Croceivirga radicis TaxID=1929488 RepID=UPI000255B280|nr:hypothetical protein [Croceivirga radicis]